VKHLPGLSFAFKSKCYLVKKGGRGSRLLSKFNGTPNEKHPQPSLYNDVVVMALEKHTPYSYQSNENNKVYDITSERAKRDPIIIPDVKPGDIFSKLQTGSTELIVPRPSVITSVVFHNSASRIKYYYVPVVKSVKEALEDYRAERPPHHQVACIISDLRIGLVHWDYPFDLAMLTTTEVCVSYPHYDARTHPREKYTNQEIIDICIKMGLPSTGTTEEMCKRLFAYAGFEN
jgi:hypothetical protein